MDKKIKISFLLALLSFTQLCSSQILRTKNWHFGYNTSLIFEKDTVIVDTSAIHSDESCTSISNVQGNLLLYSDGVSVWNKNHRVIGNGTGLLGHQSSSRGSVLLPFENKDSIFYLFTTDYQGNSNGLRYSKILNLGNDSFYIVSKNNRLHSSVAEPIGAINHQDNIRQWIIVRQFNGYNYFAFLLGRDGVIDCPTISKSTVYIGKSTNPVSAQNHLTLSPNGNLVANAYYWLHKVELSQFNRNKGIVSNSILMNNIRLPTGLAFSNNNQYLYVLERDYNIIQVKMKNYYDNQVSKGMFIIDNVYYNKVALNPTIHGQMLMIQQGAQFFGKIEFPNKADSACNYILEGLPLGKVIWRYGLPNFNVSYFNAPSLDFSYEHNCQTNEYSFTAKDSFASTDYQWRFTNKQIDITKTGKKVNQKLVDGGTWEIRLIASNSQSSDTLIKNIEMFPIVKDDFLGKDTSLCAGEAVSIVLRTPQNMHCIHWMGQTGQDYENYHKDSFTVDSTGNYFVKMTDKAFCTYYDTIQITLNPLPEKPIISYATGELAGTVKTAKYNWYLNDTFFLQTTERSILPIRNGYYRLQYLNQNGCEGPLSDSFWVGDVGVLYSFLVGVQLYPNPTDGEIHLKVAESAEHEVEIFDMGGKLILSETHDIMSEKVLHLELPAGKYYFKLTADSRYFLTTIIIQP